MDVPPAPSYQFGHREIKQAEIKIGIEFDSPEFASFEQFENSCGAVFGGELQHPSHALADISCSAVGAKGLGTKSFIPLPFTPPLWALLILSL